MTSLRQIEANRRNARLSTGPVTDEGKHRSRQNAVRHGLTAETLIDALEDAEDYAAFEMSVTAEYDAPSAVERELVLRLASLLWRLRRATAIESGLFNMQAKQLLHFQHRRRARQMRQDAIESIYRDAMVADEGHGDKIILGEFVNRADYTSSSASDRPRPYDKLTRSYMRLTRLSNYPLDRLSGYECTLWRQARQIIVALRRSDNRKRYGRAGKHHSVSFRPLDSAALYASSRSIRLIADATPERVHQLPSSAALISFEFH